MGAIAGCMIILPILMFITGFVIILILGLGLMISNGDGAQVITAGMVTWGLDCCNHWWWWKYYYYNF